MGKVAEGDDHAAMGVVILRSSILIL